MGRRRRRDGSRGACLVASGWQRCDTGTTGSASPRIYTADRMLSSVVVSGRSIVLGAPEAVLSRCLGAVPHDVVDDLAARGRRVLAVAEGRWRPGEPESDCETALRVLALIGFEGPPRPDVAEALAACRAADIKVAMVTGDHPGTAAAVAREVGLLGERGVVLDASQLPRDDGDLAACLDGEEGAVVARVTPGQKLRIARVLRQRGHVVAMTGDGVNDAPALREADVGVAMGQSGSDVTKAAADLVLLDDHFATIVNAVELGRATFANVRRLLTYHLTDNVAELAPFAAWALTGGQLPLAIGVLQVLALDIGTDMLPALALGAEPPSRRIMSGRVRKRSLIDGRLLRRALLVLGVTEAVCARSPHSLPCCTAAAGPGQRSPPRARWRLRQTRPLPPLLWGRWRTPSPAAVRPSRSGDKNWARTGSSSGRLRQSLCYSGSSSASRHLPASWAALGRPHSAGPWPAAPCRSSSPSMQATRLCIVTSRPPDFAPESDRPRRVL